MKPGFALTLSDDGIRLLHRTNRGWMLVGDADLEDPAIEDSLRFLRKTATALAPEGVATKLVLPNSQILYTEVPAPGPDEATRRSQIEAALVERTPYPIADLAYDWSGTGDTVKVAVVTRLTLSEAEAFAEDHGFNPVSFVSIPEGDTFEGEPFFGLAIRVGERLAPGDSLERDPVPVRIVGLAELPKTTVAAAEPEPANEEFAALVEPAAEVEAAVAPLEEPLEDFGGEDLIADDAFAEALAVKTADPLGSEIGPEEPDLVAEADPQESPDVDPVAFEEAPVLEMEEVAAEAAASLAPEAPHVAEDAGLWPDEPAPVSFDGLVQSDEQDVPAETFPAETVPLETGPAGTGPAEIEATVLHDEVPEAPFAIVDPDAPLEEDDQPATLRGDRGFGARQDVPPPVAGFTSRRKLPFGAKPEDTAPPNLRQTAPRLGGVTSPVGVTAPVVADSFGSDLDGAPGATPLPDPAPGGALGEALRKRAAKKPAAPKLGGLRADSGTLRGATATPPQPLRKPVKSAAQESEELTIFGARRGAAVRGKPRYLGPALIGGLIALIGLVGLWSSLSGGDSAQSTPDPTTLEQSAVDPGATVEPAPDAAPELAQDTASDTPPAEGDPAVDGAVSDPELADANLDPAAAETAGTIENLTLDNAGSVPAAIATDTPPAEDLAAAAPTEAAPAVDPAAQGSSQPVTTGTLVAQSQPDTTAADSITPESAPATPDATNLPTGQALLHDAPLAPQPLPLPYGALVKYGADGMIIPSKEGVQTPTGITLFLGKPPVAPKVRPAKVAEAAAAAVAAASVPAAPTEPASAAIPAEQPVYADPKLKGKRPASRPASLPQAQEQGTATPDPAPLVPVDPRHAKLQPKDRPAAILALAAAETPVPATTPEAAPTEAAPVPVTGGTKLAIVQSRRPAERPSDVSKAVDSALAAAVLEPDPAPEPTPVVQIAPEPKAEPIVPQISADAAVAEASTAEIDEPEPVAAAPSIPTRASVAKQATYANAIDLGKVNLIGIMGSSSDRRALIRTSNGRYVRVKVGDRFDGGRVASIGNGQLTYVKGGRTIVLKMIAAG